MSLEVLLKRVYDKCVEDGECMNWQGAVQSKRRTPAMRRMGAVGHGHCVSLRRMMLELASGKKLGPSRCATYMCGNINCVRLEHLGAVTRKTIQERNEARFDAVQRMTKAKRITEKARARAKLTLELAQEIAVAEGSQRALAAKYKVSQSTIGMIRRGEAWRDLTNPFASLAA